MLDKICKQIGTDRIEKLRAAAVALLLIGGIFGTFAVGLNGSVGTAQAAESKNWEHNYHSNDVWAVDENDGVVYSGGNDNLVIAADATDGGKNWEHSLHNDNIRDIHATDTSIYSGGWDHTVVAADPTDGSELWSHSHHSDSVFGVHAAGGSVYSGSGDNLVISSDSSDGTKEWQHSEHNDSVHAVHADSNGVLSGDFSGYVVLADSSGNIQWNVSHQTDAITEVKLDGDRIYSWSRDGTVVALDRSDGSELWTHSIHSSTVRAGGLADGIVFSGDDNARVVAADGSDGSKQMEHNEHANQVYAMAATPTDVYSGASGGTVISYSHDVSLSEPITGSVSDKVGDPIDGAIVELINESTGDTVASTSTNSSGGYSADPGENGTYRLEVTHGDTAASKTVEYTVSGETVDFQLDKYYATGSFSVETASNNTLIDDRTVTFNVESLDSDFSKVVTTNSGVWDFENDLGDETYDVTVVADGYRTRTYIIDESKDDYDVGLEEEDSGHWNQDVTLQDHTGLFDPSESYLVVESYRDGSWTNEDGAHFGTENLGTVEIAEGETYRLAVENVHGDRVSVGELIAEDWSDTDHVVTVTVGKESETYNVPDYDSGENYNPDSPPIASSTISPDDPITGETVSLDGSASRDLDGTLVEHRWTVDGELVTTGESTYWTPSESGARKITLTVEDDNGQAASTSTSLYVGANSSDRNARPENVSITASTTSPDAGESVSLTGSADDPDGNITEYRWDLDGDGTVDATGQNITHTFAEGGIYRVQLIVEDERGSTNSTEVTVSVYEETESGGGMLGGPLPGEGATPDSPLGLLLLLVGGGGALLGVWYLDQRTERDIPTVAMGVGVAIFAVVVIESLVPGTLTVPLARALDTVGPLVWVAGIGGSIWLVRRWLKTRETEARSRKLASWARRK
jgi:outer membrane protein assembly factor BamB